MPGTATRLAELPLFSTSSPLETHRDPPTRVETLPRGIATVSLPNREVDWTLVAALRARASEQLSQAVAADRARLNKTAQEELGRSIVLDLIESNLADRANAGATALPVAEQDALARAVFDSLFRLGRLQPLVDDDRVENIIIAGHDNVLLELTDGSLVDGPSVAGSDEELIDFLVFLASRSEVNARGFSEAQPRLHLRLDGGSRLAAAAWVTPRPSVVIRRHRLMEVTLEDLVARQMLTPVTASFLRAAVRARKSIIVSGGQGAGKTTLVRALCAEIDPFEAIGTFETEYELHLHELRDRHRIVHPWEARPGSGERGPDGRQAGEFTLDEALVDSFRFNLSRQIVGEVRGKEVWAMIKAMESGTGSISTTHAADAIAAVRKLVTCAMEAGSHVTHELATSKLAATIDLIVHLDLRTERDGETSRRRRRVAEIIALDTGEREIGYATTHVFAPDLDGVATPAVLPDSYRALAAHGFDLAEYLAQQQVRS
ncbi:ATPase, T2SS/T4P/T4SS family [Aeromicrobium sp.]|uniref:CpaF family protein n=1 Tax=Aeromicrobium sp. TaxID=1871063 RepID=UPI0019A17E8C|nr:ATPase, T2SS/T4P/T4SS family [Aeromicrobium sp.]MBC7633559.1 CpaF family protein [Aeromicrobium sp.]